MSEPRKTFRFRNGREGWASKELIHTFWVGQRVVRGNGERWAFIDGIAEVGVVTALPTKDDRWVHVTTEEDKKNPSHEARWSPTECAPLRKHHEQNMKRLKSASDSFRNTLRKLDENGFLLED